MAVFAYKAVDTHRKSVDGVITADSPRHAREQLRGLGLVVQTIATQHTSASSSLLGWFLRSRGFGSRVTSATRELSTLLSVGVPLLDALDTLIRQHKGRFGLALTLLRENVSSGMSLADAMREQTDVFDALTISMVEVGENAGNLEDVLEQVASFKERSLELKDRVTSALIYPAIVFCTSLGVGVFLMTVVVPMLLSTLLEAGQTLPWPTRVLRTMSDLLLTRGWLLAIGAIAAVAGVSIGLQTAAGKSLWHRVLLRLPVIGTMTRYQTISRISLVVSTLMRSGIVYLQAVEIAARATRNLVFREALLKSNQQIRSGLDLGIALEQTGVFPPLVVQVFAVGQATGKLEEMLERLAVTYDRQVATQSGRLASVLEPVLIIGLSVFVGFIVFATLLPILEAGNVL